MKTLTWLMLLIGLMVLGTIHERAQVQQAYDEGRADGYAFAQEHTEGE